MSGWSLVEQVAERLRGIGDLPGGGRIGGFWIRPDPYLDREKAVVLVLDLLDDEVDDDLGSPSARAAVARSLEVIERVAEALDDIIPTTCWFGSSEDLKALGPPLDPQAFHPLGDAA